MSRRYLHALVITTLCGLPMVAAADNPPAKPAKSEKLPADAAMKLSQQAMTQVSAAETALEKGDKAAAKTALSKSKQALSKLYDTPPVTAMLNEFDEALNALRGKSPALEPLDLAPLNAAVSSYQAYIDPQVAAGVREAGERAKAGDTKGTEEALRIARNRVAVDMAFLPVEEAYMRVLAAQQALQTNDTKTALSLLRNVPIVVSELELSRPLVPVRFKLQEAAAAADAKQWDKAKSLLNDANRQVKQLESMADAETKKALDPIAQQIQQLDKTQPKPDQIRAIAKRTRSVGSNEG